MANVLEELENRGYIEQYAHGEELKKLIDSGEKISFYIGIDPTADSMHIGHFIPLMVASRLQKAGHKPYILMGGGTATIGDPSGKTDMRKMLDRAQLDSNVECIKEQAKRFVSFEGENSAVIVNNADWLLGLNYIDFMKEIGSQFTVSTMIAQECYKNRLGNGLTFFEMGYLLLQSYDFLYLHDKYGVKLQIGGNDQWSNILGGVDLIRKMGKEDSFAMTMRLLTNKDGVKMGKTVSGALWLNKDKCSPYDFYQYWRNIDDADVKKVMLMLTFMEEDEINELTKYNDERMNIAKKRVAFEITKLIHGEEEALKAQEAAESLFGQGSNLDNMPEYKLEDMSILNAIVGAGFAPSKGQAKDLIKQGGITLNDVKVDDVGYQLQDDDFKEGYAILKKGKKGFVKLVK